MKDLTQRYQRQHKVSELGIDSQHKLNNAHVLIIGLGGLGSPLSLLLAGAGIGTLTLVDADTVSLSNLHRQILFTEKDIDQPKASIAQKKLSELNSQIKIHANEHTLNFNNAHSLIKQASVVVDAADNFLVSYLLSDVCMELQKPLISASVIGTTGYIGGFCGSSNQPAPSLRAVFPTPPKNTMNCSSAGVTGPSAAIIGSYQAQETLKIILQDPSQLLGKLMRLELWNYRQTIIDFNHASEPTVKADFVTLQSLSHQDILLDVRTKQEVSKKPITHIDSKINTLHIPFELLLEKTDLCLNKENKRLICVCQSGLRALSAAQWLLDNGYRNVGVTAL